MGALVLPSVLRQQPQQVFAIDRSNPLGAKVLEHIALNGIPRTLVSGAAVTFGPGGSTVASAKGRSLRGTGAAARASVPLDLSKYSAITIAFWFYWDGYANDDSLGFEFTSNGTAPGGFAFNPNSSGPGFGKLVVFGAYTGGTVFATSWNRPSAGVWHRCVIIFDGTGVAQLAVDGVMQSGVIEQSPPQSGTFANDTLHLLSRNESNLFGTGNLQDITFYRGALSPAEVAQDYVNPWQIFKAPARRLWYSGTAAATPTASLAWVELDDAASIVALLTNRIAAAWVEDGETATMASTVTDRGVLVWTEQGDAHAIVVAAASPPMAVVANLAWTDADDEASVVARLTNSAALVVSEQGDAWQIVVNSALPPGTPAPNIYAATIMRATSTNRTVDIGPASINITAGFP